VGLRDFLRRVFVTGPEGEVARDVVDDVVSTAGIEDDLLAMGTSAVMGRAVPLGDTLLLPSRLVFTLPDHELRLVAPGSQDALTRSLRRAVRDRAEEQLARSGADDGEPHAVVGADDLRVTLVAGSVREADAWFEVRPEVRPDLRPEELT
jgi:hypothetical protein